MAYTHSFEIKINGAVIEGEFDFDAKKFKTEGGEEMTVAQHGIVQQLLELFCRTMSCSNEITKIELVAK